MNRRRGKKKTTLITAFRRLLPPNGPGSYRTRSRCRSKRIPEVKAKGKRSYLALKLLRETGGSKKKEDHHLSNTDLMGERRSGKESLHLPSGDRLHDLVIVEH